MPEQPDPDRIKRAGFIIIGLLIGIMLFGFLVSQRDRSESSSNTPRTTSSSTFKEVRNDCGECGKASIVGGWESEDGRSLIFTESGRFSANFPDGTRSIGDYEKTTGQLCLLPDSGGRSCLTYQQKTDAMKLEEAIYIRR